MFAHFAVHSRDDVIGKVSISKELLTAKPQGKRQYFLESIYTLYSLAVVKWEINIQSQQGISQCQQDWDCKTSVARKLWQIIKSDPSSYVRKSGL